MGRRDGPVTDFGFSASDAPRIPRWADLRVPHCGDGSEDAPPLAAARPRRRLDRTVAQLVALTDYAVVFALVVACDVIYHAISYGMYGTVYGLRFAAVAAVTYVAIIAFRQGYALPSLIKRGRTSSEGVGGRSGMLSGGGSLSGGFVWIATLTADLVILFLLGQGGDLSRGIALSALLVGLAGLPWLHRAQGALVRRAVEKHGVRARHMVLVGCEADVTRYLAATRPETRGFLALGAVYLPDATHDGHRMWLADRPRIQTVSLADAVTAVRGLAADDAVLVMPWNDVPRIEALVATFLQLPLSLVLAPDPVFQASLERRVSPLGRMDAFETETGLVGLPILQQPFNLADRAVKRMLDIVGALAGLVLLAPVFALVALLIKRDSPGPVFYRQVRNGFNEEPFRILKFRSMVHVADDAFVQAQAGDGRVTRIGRFIRRWSIDELPQLVNVLLGQMSLVGPRPHAAAHNSSVADQIANYACRHHVKPGITGWAQVHGLRGGTDDEAMRRRVAHDLYYIQNWSPWLDIRILVRTVFSPEVYRNAY